ncbi:MAG: exodeoxyribonuclease V subunit gamma [Lentisphaeria bacterium]
MSFRVLWGDQLENLADALFGQRFSFQDPFMSECVVVGSPLLATWLKQYFLYDFKHKKQPVLANIDFVQIHPFVNDWVSKAVENIPIGKRAALQHPFSKEAMQWRIWQFLFQEKLPDECAVLKDYISKSTANKEYRTWTLAGKLSQLFNDYMNNRPEMLEKWEQNDIAADVQQQFPWQPLLWNYLVLTSDRQSYLKLFEKNALLKLKNSGIAQTYSKISVFHVVSITDSYFHFFQALSEFMDVTVYAFNPCQEFWLEDQDPKKIQVSTSENRDEEILWHPLLNSFGKGAQYLLAKLLDYEPQNSPEELFGHEEQDHFLLHQIQNEVRTYQVGDIQADASIQLHICHSPMREVEVLHDQLLQWFSDHPKGTPRQIRVLVPEMESYAPYIEAVFKSGTQDAQIPITIQMSKTTQVGPVAETFLKILKLSHSRVTSLEVVEIFELTPLYSTLEFSREDVLSLIELVKEAGIRWGIDQKHVEENLGVNVEALDIITWRHGLDRLLAGMAMGHSDESEAPELVTVGQLKPMLICNNMEGHATELLNILCVFLDKILTSIQQLEGNNRVSIWLEITEEILTRFFADTEDSYQELHDIRNIFKQISESAAFAQDPSISADLITKIMEEAILGQTPYHYNKNNTVLFTSLQSMNVTPCDCVAILGLNEGVFPRADTHLAFDLMGIHPKKKDPSLRYQDRLAILEVLMSTREQLLLFYTGYSTLDNQPIPPSIVVTELKKYLNRCPLKIFKHKLQAYNPVYFRSGSSYFSYSYENWEAAVQSRKNFSDKRENPVVVPQEKCNPTSISLLDLQKFFTNPAKIYMNEVLQIRLPDYSNDLPEEQEIIDMNPLENYQSTNYVLHSLLQEKTNSKSDDFTYLQEAGVLALGASGKSQYLKIVTEIQEFLKETIKQPDEIIKNALQKTQNAVPEEKNIEIDETIISVSLPIIQIGTQRYLIFCRYASLKSKDRIQALLAHLCGHAAGLSPFTTVLIGKKDKNTKTELFEPISEFESRQRLEKILELYFSGLQKILPFTPETSDAFQKEFLKNGNDIDSAKRKAIKIWQGNSLYSFSENQEAYLSAAWRKNSDGPIDHPEFAEIAMLFWQGKTLDEIKTGETEIE